MPRSEGTYAPGVQSDFPAAGWPDDPPRPLCYQFPVPHPAACDGALDGGGWRRATAFWAAAVHAPDPGCHHRYPSNSPFDHKAELTIFVCSHVSRSDAMPPASESRAPTVWPSRSSAASRPPRGRRPRPPPSNHRTSLEIPIGMRRAGSLSTAQTRSRPKRPAARYARASPR